MSFPTALESNEISQDIDKDNVHRNFEIIKDKVKEAIENNAKIGMFYVTCKFEYPYYKGSRSSLDQAIFLVKKFVETLGYKADILYFEDSINLTVAWTL